MKVLVACEESQRVCIEFRKRGHIAFSCDIKKSTGGHPEWHIQEDVTRILSPYRFMPPDSFDWYYGVNFITESGRYCEIHGGWDLIIAHPPCTRLCNSGQRWIYYGSDEYKLKKIREQNEAIAFFMQFVHANCPRIAIENPVGIMSTIFRKPDCIYNPYDFEGETESKKTCLWLKGLSGLIPTRKEKIQKQEITYGIWKGIFDGKQYAYNDPELKTLRSKTPIGVAIAMAEQWGGKSKGGDKNAERYDCEL